MKTLSILVFALIVSFCAISQFAISPPISVTNEDDSYGYRSPKVISYGENNDQVMVFWSRIGTEEALFISTLNEGVFTAPVTVPTGSLDPNLWSGNLGPSIASFGNNIYITFEVYGTAIYCVHSSDGGISWEEPAVAFDPPIGRYATIPNIAVDSSGEVYIAYVNTNSAEEDAHYGLVKSSNQGLDFSDEVLVNENVPSDEVCECCNGNIEIGPNDEIYVGFRNNTDNLRDCWIVKSTNSGDSFEEVYDVDDSDWMLNGCPQNGPDFTVTEDNVVTVFFTNATDFDDEIYFTILDSESGNVSTAESVPLADPEANNQNSARIASNGSGEVLVVFQESFQFSQNIGFSSAYTGDGLGQLSFMLNDSPGNQKQPDVMAIDYMFHVVYEDTPTGTVMYQTVNSDPTSVLEEERKELLLYPNPAENLIQLGGNVEVKNYKIISAQGISILEEKVAGSSSNNSVSVDVSSLEPGVYLLSVNQTEFMKFIKE